MGQLVDGAWQPGALVPRTAGGDFVRAHSSFRAHVPAVAAGRYHLYASYACPWAHRTLITRALCGLEDAISVTIVDPHMGESGWPFTASAPDPFGPSQHLWEVYARADAQYTGRATVPILWDKQTRTIVNNESREIMRMFAIDFAPLHRAPDAPDLSPAALRPQIDAILDQLFEAVNNGVYRCGFASTQAAYDPAVRELFDALAHWERELEGKRWLCGDALTEADIALFCTCLRFDLVYFSHFKCNVRRLRDHENLWRLTRQLWQHPRVQPTCHLDQIKTHYYWSQESINPTRVVPAGPELLADLNAAI
jgi:putative glutathione S-transferase